MQTNKTRIRNIERELSSIIRGPAVLTDEAKSDVRLLFPFTTDEVIVQAIKEKGRGFKQHILASKERKHVDI